MASRDRNPAFSGSPIPTRAGIGLKPAHYADILNGTDNPAWFEVHPENYMCDGGPALRYLDAVRADHPLSLHGVSLSLGSATGVNRDWLAGMRRLIARYEPALVSEHLSWSAVDGVYLNDLLPLPYTEECLRVMAAHILLVQDVLGRRLLIENPSTYLTYRHSVIPEAEFLAALVWRTGCGLLVDVNNLYVNARNHGIDPVAWLRAIPPAAVGEFHLAGHAVNRHGDRDILIDDHGSPVVDAVWALYETALRVIGPRPTLIERDTNIPPFAALLREARMADEYLAVQPVEAVHG